MKDLKKREKIQINPVKTKCEKKTPESMPLEEKRQQGKRYNKSTN